jgi:predicted ATPase
VISSVTFRNFKALRNTSVALSPFNLVIGPNGSGKSSLIQALLHLKNLATLPVNSSSPFPGRAEALEITFRFAPPFSDIEVRLRCSGEVVCDLLEVSGPGAARWSALRDELAKLSTFVFDHHAMARGSATGMDEALLTDGGNLPGVLARRRRLHPQSYVAVEADFCRLFPEFSGLDVHANGDGRDVLSAILGDGGGSVAAENLSQGTLYTLAMLALAHDPAPPSCLCIEELDRGIHPRMLREIRDALYRLSYPSSFGSEKPPVQVVATTHSPYLLDLFRDHPQEVVIAQKEGQAARFERLADRSDLSELLQEATLGDIWYAGILGGVPDEEHIADPTTRELRPE